MKPSQKSEPTTGRTRRSDPNKKTFAGFRTRPATSVNRPSGTLHLLLSVCAFGVLTWLDCRTVDGIGNDGEWISRLMFSPSCPRERETENDKTSGAFDGKHDSPGKRTARNNNARAERFSGTVRRRAPSRLNTRPFPRRGDCRGSRQTVRVPPEREGRPRGPGRTRNRRRSAIAVRRRRSFRKSGGTYSWSVNSAPPTIPPRSALRLHAATGRFFSGVLRPTITSAESTAYAGDETVRLCTWLHPSVWISFE